MTESTRLLGRSGIEVSPLGMGCWAIGGGAWGKVDDSESKRALRRAYDLGITFFDTANIYGKGHSEKLIAEALSDVREKLVIATKFGYTFEEEDAEEDYSQSTTLNSIRQSCEASLRRLNTDYIDLFQFHINEYDPDRAFEVRDSLEILVREGKIRAYGWSTDFPEGVPTFAEGEFCTAVQLELNVLADNPIMISVAEALNLALINRGPLAMGLLTGKFKTGARLPTDDIRGPNSPAWMKFFQAGEPNPEFLTKLESVREILQSNGRTLSQGALAWLWARSPLTVPIPGFKTVAQVEENCGAITFGALTAEQMTEIAQILETDEV